MNLKTNPKKHEPKLDSNKSEKRFNDLTIRQQSFDTSKTNVTNISL